MKDDTPRSSLSWGGALVALLVLILLLGLTAAAVFFALYLTGAPLKAITVIPPSPTVETVVHTAPVQTATPVPQRVCTDIPGGRLHVRFAAGDGSEVRGYLAEGESVLPTTETETIKGETWRRISSPIAGWVNARYLCAAE